MRSPFSFISIKSRVVTLDMLTFQLRDLAPPELAIGELRMRNRQVRLSDSLVSVTHDVEVEGPRPPALAPFPASFRLDRQTPREQLRRRQGRLEQHHLIQERRLRHRPD